MNYREDGRGFGLEMSFIWCQASIYSRQNIRKTQRLGFLTLRDHLISRLTAFARVRKAVAKRGQLLLTVKGSGVGKTTTCDIAEVAISVGN
jgi:hypothetical protein